ncbi:MAG: hypothetical protein IKP40_13725 [Clostridia bacterium]|nr:hypothetical protein [Clostridia bacterium]
MFKKSGTKIKLIAKILFWVETACVAFIALGIATAPGGINLSMNDPQAARSKGAAIVLAVLVLILGAASAYITSLLMHAYGELVDKTKDSNYLLTRIADHTKHLSVDVDKATRTNETLFPPVPKPVDNDEVSFAPDHRT